MRTVARTLLALVTTALGVALIVLPAAGAESATRIADDGWWWRAQTGIGATLPPPPNVGDDQLMVQSTVEGAQAIAAVSVVLADGQVNPVLTLDVADDQGGAQAVLLACQAGAAWTGVHAGRWDSKPTADCTTSVTGIRSEDGAQWTFPAGPLQFNDKLNVVIVPGTDADTGAPTTFSLVFDAPTATSVATVDGAAPPATTSPTTAAPPATDPPSTAGGFVPPSTAPPTTFAPPTTAVVVPVQPALEPEDQGMTATAPIVNEATAPVAVSATEAPSRALARAMGIVVALAGLAGGWFVLRGSAFGGAVATVDTPVQGGLARFRTERTSDPTPVS